MVVKKIFNYKNRLGKKSHGDDEEDESSFPFIQKQGDSKFYKNEIKNTVKVIC